MKATARRRQATAILALVGAAALSAPGPDGETPDNWERLRSMPPELRLHLADQLKEFDLLGRAERDAVRTLDARLAEEPAANREAYDAVLRRYHLWVRGLPESQQNELRAAEPSKRMALVSKFRGERPAADRPRAAATVYPYADFGGVSPFVLARRISGWLGLTGPEKAELLKLPEPDRVKRTDELARKAADRVHRPSPAELEEVAAKAAQSPRYPPAKKADSRRRFVDNYYFVVKPPARVAPEKLLEFDRAMPPWIRAGFDSLPPEEARRRLTILYRLVHGGNDATKAATTPGGRPAEPAAPLPSVSPSTGPKTPPTSTASPF